jgi:lauroyl/myristoyl acyltransferase
MTSNSASVVPGRHAPELTWSRRLLGRFHFSGIFWYRLPEFGVRHNVLSVRSFPFFVFLFTTIFYLSLWKIGRAIADNLEAVLGPCGFFERQLRMWRTLRQFAWCFGEGYEHLVRPERFQVEFEGNEWLEAMDPSEGIIFVTAHIGHWEMASHLPSGELRRRVHVVREEEMDPEAQRYVEQRIRESGPPGLVTHFAGDDPALGIALADALRRGEVVALQGDRPRVSGRTLTGSLFGKPMPLPVGPAALARATGVPCVPVFSFREGRFRYRLIVREPIRVPRTADREADLGRAVDRMAAEIEWAIRQKPHQWFCFRKLWE